ncbi:DNA methyltransferase [Aliterella atlantica]|uniref:DNA methylase N-4/N-6 domain-containing protein n=1 Tax=Aliterella atlantica CENA595 TaxID=1618023 RepID=A0A0D8ZPJ7_9CYAN|nr:DNA methyltransferase [Aliterella atlantica]KJH70424.1 hypothetical protein UH38_18355 [Aliterella atlantica CENA595]
MAHISEDSQKLKVHTTSVLDLQQLFCLADTDDKVYLLIFPPERNDQDAANSQIEYQEIYNFCNLLSEYSTVCILTTPADAARLQTFMEKVVTLKLWVAMKCPAKVSICQGKLPEHHLALLIFTRYQGALKHCKTRIEYTYCPSCGKTTKDYGGKKHLYHAYGTLMSDVWRDMEFNPYLDIEPLVNRLQDIFGINLYKEIKVIDFAQCDSLVSRFRNYIRIENEPLKPTHTLESQLIQGDCLGMLRTIPDNSIDFCFADPPYNLKKKYQGYNDEIELIEYFAWCDRWLSELARILKPGRTCAILNIPLWAIRHYKYLSSVLNYQSWIVWEALGLPVRMVMPAHYSILCFSKGGSRPLPGLSFTSEDNIEENSFLPLAEFFCARQSCISNRRHNNFADQSYLTDLWYDIHRLKHNSRRVDHPCQLPPLLMQRLISLFTLPNEIILDCFNGSGTSTLAAQQLNRRFIGIELSQQYHDLAMDRHRQLTQGQDPFGKQTATPNAKNSRVQRIPKQKYEVTKKQLQLEVKRIAKELGRLPTRAEVANLSSNPIEYFDNYFINWAEACAAARTTGMSEFPIIYESAWRQLGIDFKTN